MKARSFALSALLFASLSAAAQSNDVVIGIINPTSGPETDEGAYQRNSAQLAVDLANTKGGINGKKFRLVVQDNESTNPGTVAAFNKLAEDRNLIAMIGPIKSPQMLSVAPAVQKTGIPMLSRATLSRLTENNKWFFRIGTAETMSTLMLAKYVKDDMKAKKVYVLNDDNAYGKTNSDFFDKYAKDIGLSVVKRGNFNVKTRDFASVLASIKESQADVVVSFSNSYQAVAAFIEQLHDSKLPVKVLGNTTFQQTPIVNQVKEKANGVQAFAPYVADENEVVTQFTKDYRAAFKSEPDATLSWTYDAVNLVLEGYKNGGTTREKLRDALFATKNYKGLTATFSFDSKGEGANEFAIVQVENGKSKLVKRLKASN